MTTLRFHQQALLPTAQDIAAVERTLGRALPEEYASFLRMNGGGRSYSYIGERPMMHAKLTTWASVHPYGIGTRLLTDFDREMTPLVGRDRLVVAESLSLDFVVLSLVDGSVSWCSLDPMPTARPVPLRAGAPDFTRFLASLSLDPSQDLASRQMEPMDRPDDEQALRRRVASVSLAHLISLKAYRRTSFSGLRSGNPQPPACTLACSYFED